MAEPLRYALTTIADLLQVPCDRREACMRDVLLSLDTAELAFGERASAALRWPMTWIDDGGSNVTMQAGGETLLTLEIQKAPAP